MKSFARFIKEDASADVIGASADDQVRAIRNLIAALISSGAMDAFITRDLLMKEEIHTYSATNDEERYRRRLKELRSGLVAVSGSLLGLLKQDTQLDDDLLRKHGITKWDKTEASDPGKTHAKHNVANAKRQELIAKRGVLNAKQAELANNQRQVQRDIAKSGAR